MEQNKPAACPACGQAQTACCRCKHTPRSEQTQRQLRNRLSRMTGQLARYVMIWSIFIGIVACTRQRGHARVTVIVDLFHGKAKKVYEAILQIIVIIALVWLTKLCFDLVMHAVESGQKAPITKIPYWFMYSSMVIGFFFSIIREIELFVKDYILKQPEPDEFEEGMVSE